VIIYKLVFILLHLAFCMHFWLHINKKYNRECGIITRRHNIEHGKNLTRNKIEKGFSHSSKHETQNLPVTYNGEILYSVAEKQKGPKGKTQGYSYI